MLRFVVYLAQSGITYQSISCYLSGLRFFQVANGLADPCLLSLPRLQYVLRGIRRNPALGIQRRRLPITPEIMSLLLAAWSNVSPCDAYNASMLWAACCMGFFGFLRSGEFTCPARPAFTPDMLSPRDITVDSHTRPSVVSVHLRRSKADPFGLGVTLHLGRTHQPVCPVTAILSYIVMRGQTAGPLFLFQDGSTLSKDKLLTHIRQALAYQGFDAAGISGHSFRIGAATAAAQAGLDDSLIQTLGRWRSSAYLRYIHLPINTLAATSSRLLHPLP